MTIALLLLLAVYTLVGTLCVCRECPHVETDTALWELSQKRV